MGSIAHCAKQGLLFSHFLTRNWLSVLLQESALETISKSCSTRKLPAVSTRLVDTFYRPKFGGRTICVWRYWPHRWVKFEIVSYKVNDIALVLMLYNICVDICVDICVVQSKGYCWILLENAAGSWFTIWRAHIGNWLRSRQVNKHGRGKNRMS